MNTHRRQSRTPKPQPMEKQIERIRRDLEALGFDVTVERGNGRYKPTITVSAWPKMEKSA